jgi:hypothetical protein
MLLTDAEDITLEQSVKRHKVVSHHVSVSIVVI